MLVHIAEVEFVMLEHHVRQLASSGVATPGSQAWKRIESISAILTNARFNAGLNVGKTQEASKAE